MVCELKKLIYAVKTLPLSAGGSLAWQAKYCPAPAGRRLDNSLAVSLALSSFFSEGAMGAILCIYPKRRRPGAGADLPKVGTNRL